VVGLEGRLADVDLTLALFELLEPTGDLGLRLGETLLEPV